MNVSIGTVYLIGAGPGDPGLITLRAVDCLRRADVVLHDYLVNVDILQHASSSAEIVCLGRHGRSTIWSQVAINERVISEAKQGRTVARLKGGDPMVFGHAAEELAALKKHDIPFEVVPGVTAALAAAASAEVPVTHRDYSSAVAFITGQENPTKDDSAIDYRALANFPGTLVFYMGITTADRWTQKLIDAGMSPATPVAAIRRCTWSDQRTIRCRLDELAAFVTPYSKFPPPAIAIVGPVTSLQQGRSWFERRPLFGSRVMVTRPPHQSIELRRRLIDYGADIITQPAIEISAPDDWQSVDDALRRLSEFDYLVFSSVNGVHHLMERLTVLGLDLRALAGVKLAAIGPQTSEALAMYHLSVDRQPSESFRAESLLDVLADEAAGRRFLLARASRGREVLAEGLADAGGDVEQVVVYSSRDVEQARDEVRSQLEAGQVDWITVTSSSIASSLVKMFGENLSRARLVTISPVTSATLRRQGFEPSVEATSYTMDGIVEAILSDA